MSISSFASLLVFLQISLAPFPEYVYMTTMCRGKYFGQPVPGIRAEKFAPGIISMQGRYEYALHFSPNGREFLFTVQESEESDSYLMYSKMVKKIWTEPCRLSLSNGRKKGEMEAFFTPDGRKIYFAAYDSGRDVRIWEARNRLGKNLTSELLDSPLNDGPAFYPTTSGKNRIYYTNLSAMKIWSAGKMKGSYSVLRDEQIPLVGHPFIDKDERFMLLDAKDELGYGKLDIYVVVRMKDEKWSDPVNLGPEVNTPYYETCPSLSHDGRYLFFSRYDEPGELSDIYWIDASVIDDRIREELDARITTANRDLFPFRIFHACLF
jgi:hypothetical protein